MSRPSDVRVRGACLYFLPVTFRVPLEFGPDRTIEMPAHGTFDLTATDFLDLAAQLGA